jgi:hypothetical protein
VLISIMPRVMTTVMKCCSMNTSLQCCAYSIAHRMPKPKYSRLIMPKNLMLGYIMPGRYPACRRPTCITCWITSLKSGGFRFASAVPLLLLLHLSSLSVIEDGACTSEAAALNSCKVFSSPAKALILLGGTSSPPQTPLAGRYPPHHPKPYLLEDIPPHHPKPYLLEDILLTTPNPTCWKISSSVANSTIIKHSVTSSHAPEPIPTNENPFPHPRAHACVGEAWGERKPDLQLEQSARVCVCVCVCVCVLPGGLGEEGGRAHP